MKTSVLIPAYNEESRIRKTLMGIIDIEEIDDIVVVDDGSLDETYSQAQGIKKVRAFKLEKNMGKGYAMNFGLGHMNEADIIVFLDADVCESSSEIKKLINPILKGECDVTIAAFPPAKKKGGFGLVKRLARGGVRLFTGREINSSLSGQRAFKREVIERLGEVPAGYGVEVGMTIDILRSGYTIQEVPVHMTHNETGRNISGFKHRGRQFYHILLILLKKAMGK
ncbi:Glycosyl transferase family 2 [Peptoclostridium litorale DSM 5388]|uniref:Putative glycosyltransferase n=1 Tax=Peptoclostridium litorale DSM 5388 TaxID=1121324 RepID=A0A069RIT9_PEPLI|nr:glycosyltransferase family 2 protein [Peptoclostridium litorale]KDR94137.1 putative glycosyltransferase [Peptoclostridium litorale DSM 5388]SIN81328.1 Glycosyl transferase family 2 [Peptoclostridium litorale DSM 5388]